MTEQHEIAHLIGVRVRAARSQVRMSRKALAAAADVSERYLNQLEAGAANVSIGVISRVAQALNTNLADLVSPMGGNAVSGPQSSSIHAPLSRLIAGMTLREQQGAIAPLESWLEAQRGSLKGIALLGLRGAGKSTIGRLFAARHALPFLSVTREIEARVGMPLNDLFNLGGPDAYRTLENEVVRELASRDERMVLETAGGIVANKDALDVIFSAFKTIWLKAAPEEHLKRVIHQGDMRPIHGDPKALEHLKSLLAGREQDYQRADFNLDTTGLTPDECVDVLDQMTGATALPP